MKRYEMDGTLEFSSAEVNVVASVTPELACYLVKTLTSQLAEDRSGHAHNTVRLQLPLFGQLRSQPDTSPAG